MIAPVRLKLPPGPHHRMVVRRRPRARSTNSRTKSARKPASGTSITNSSSSVSARSVREWRGEHSRPGCEGRQASPPVDSWADRRDALSPSQAGRLFSIASGIPRDNLKPMERIGAMASLRAALAGWLLGAGGAAAVLPTVDFTVGGGEVRLGLGGLVAGWWRGGNTGCCAAGIWGRGRRRTASR